jgi:mannose-6-phosphate isomerase-like protein (cupin superfamily)
MPRHLPAEDGRIYHLFGGDQVTLKLTGKETDGAYTLFETVIPPGMGPLPHVHTREEESFCIVKGELEFIIRGQTIRPKAGDVLIAPKDVPHVFRNVGQTPAKMIIVCRPAGFENFIEEFAQIPPDAPADVPRMAAVAAKYGITFVAS